MTGGTKRIDLKKVIAAANERLGRDSAKDAALLYAIERCCMTITFSKVAKSWTVNGARSLATSKDLRTAVRYCAAIEDTPDIDYGTAHL